MLVQYISAAISYILI